MTPGTPFLNGVAYQEVLPQASSLALLNSAFVSEYRFQSAVRHSNLSALPEHQKSIGKTAHRAETVWLGV
jgi:hypothetical protein